MKAVMITIKFSKARAQEFIQALARGNPILAPDQKWTGNDMLALAGACFFAAMSHGPSSFYGTESAHPLKPKDQKAIEDTFFNDLHGAVEFYAHLTQLVRDGLYDEQYEPEVRALVTQQGNVTKTIRPVRGFRFHQEN